MKTCNRLFLVCALIAICFAYPAWMTGFTFVFREPDLLPNYNMLAKAFAKGQLFIDETPPEDYLECEREAVFVFWSVARSDSPARMVAARPRHPYRSHDCPFLCRIGGSVCAHN